MIWVNRSEHRLVFEIGSKGLNAPSPINRLLMNLVILISRHEFRISDLFLNFSNIFSISVSSEIRLNKMLIMFMNDLDHFDLLKRRPNQFLSVTLFSFQPLFERHLSQVIQDYFCPSGNTRKADESDLLGRTGGWIKIYVIKTWIKILSYPLWIYAENYYHTRVYLNVFGQ